MPTDNDGIKRIFLRAMDDGQLVPIVTRHGWVDCTRTFRPTPAPLCWPSSNGGGTSAVQVVPYAGLLSAIESAGNDDGKFSWLGVAEAATGAVSGIGSDNNASGNHAADEGFSSDGSMRPGGTQPFEYQPSNELNNVSEELAASTRNPNYAAKMLGYDRDAFGDMVHAMKYDHESAWQRQCYLARQRRRGIQKQHHR
ncbi:hypothetical protein [Burkholderia sp. WAC0059]|uniref:hypothetical protein n=1 Tax=Burkholderia sp. WAC0059 TaxID=2066022 RepID=UPI0015E066BC|nr:hypothetical protein [Burkholderia sp. WAC0059]